MKRIILLIALLFSVSYSYGQSKPDCPTNTVFCRGECREPRNCGIGPPPPGLVVPIDTHTGLLFFAGLGLGIYFLVSSGKFSASSKP